MFTRAHLFDIAQRFVGIEEVGGKVDNPQIMAMLKLDNSWPTADEVPWCSGFANYCAYLCRAPRSKDLRARSWLEVGRGTPVRQTAAMLETVLRDFPREETGALIVADAVLARALGWTCLTPLLAAGLAPRDLRGSGETLRLACHRALAASADAAVRLAQDLVRRAARLRRPGRQDRAIRPVVVLLPDVPKIA